MPAEVVTKSDYARRRGVRSHAVSMWISRGKLTAPALRDDGRIDVRQADRQLGVRIDPVRRAGREVPRPAPSRGSAPIEFGPAADLLRAKALSAMVDAERKRRELEAERGRYMLTEKAEAAFRKVLGDFILQIEQSLPDLANALGLDAAGRIALRKWWRGQRVQFAAYCREAADASPEFEEDTESYGQ